jgi:hypothetical protein
VDLKIIFGQLDQQLGTIDQQTAVTVSWLLAKLAAFHLSMQVETYEVVMEKLQCRTCPLHRPFQYRMNTKTTPFFKIYEIMPKMHNTSSRAFNPIGAADSASTHN